MKKNTVNLSDSIIDKNLAIEEEVKEPDNVWHDLRKMEDAAIYGLYQPRETPYFMRMPLSLAESLGELMVNLNRRTAGGRIRFMTDSSYVAVRVEKPRREDFIPHMSYVGASAFDAYVKVDDSYIFAGTVKPKVEINEGYEGIIYFGDRKMKDITLDFPPYDQVTNVYIGLQAEAKTEKSPAYRFARPVVFYGSSITEGACASRPGNTYEGFLSRRLDMDYVNIGLSGNAKGEHAMAEYIASLPMSAFVLDYDHNSPPEALQATHWDMYQTVRAANPDLPILMISRTDVSYRAAVGRISRQKKLYIIENYLRAVQEGDAHVDFLDGQSIFSMLAGAESTVDGTHPNDLGFFAMANAIEPFLRKYLTGTSFPA